MEEVEGGGWREVGQSQMEAAEAKRGGWQEMGLGGGTASCSSAPSSPSSIRGMGDSSPMSDHYEFACQMEEADGGGGRLGGMGSLSFKTCSSAPSSPSTVRSLSIDFRDFPPMSEWEEIPSQRWLPALEPLNDAGVSHLPPVAPPQHGEDERKPSRRWLLPLFLRPRSALAAETDGSRDGWRKQKGERLLWYRDLGRYAFGDFSMAVEQANNVLEDQCQIESGTFGAFVGIYDGHGGPQAARYVCDHLYRNFREVLSGPLGGTCEAIKTAFLQTEEGFTARVAEMWDSNPRIAIVGSCCLVGVICHQTLYVANLGDSRVVLGAKSHNTGEIAAIQLSTDHNAYVESVREELKAQHPYDPNIVVLKHGVWRIKGITQVSRSIGDAYMKHAEYNREPLDPRFRIRGPMNMPILSVKPAIIAHPLRQNDSFLIFASDGLWEQLSNQEAVKIVHRQPQVGAAKRLIKAALQEAARKREMKYSRLQQVDRGIRRFFHDDITVIVLFLNHDLVSRDFAQAPSLSIRSPLGL